jgi:hypothetical protein
MNGSSGPLPRYQQDTTFYGGQQRANHWYPSSHAQEQYQQTYNRPQQQTQAQWQSGQNLRRTMFAQANPGSAYQHQQFQQQRRGGDRHKSRKQKKSKRARHTHKNRK